MAVMERTVTVGRQAWHCRSGCELTSDPQAGGRGTNWSVTALKPQRPPQ